MEVQTLAQDKGNMLGLSSDTMNMLTEIRELKKQLSFIESNTRDSKIKEMVWYPKREDHVDVYLRTSVVMVGDIDAVKQEFLCEFYLSVKWKEPRLKGRMDESQIDWDSEWEPDIYFVDMVSSDIFERHRGLLDRKDDDDIPTVLFYYHVRGIFKEVLDVRTFPFDYQQLDITVTTNFQIEVVTLKKDPERNDNIRTWNFASKHQWDLQPHLLSYSRETKKEPGSSPNTFSLYHIQMHAARKWSFYIYNIAFVMSLITGLTFTAYAVRGSNSTGDRLQITMTLLLASVAFKYYVEGFLPTVPYLTMVESYIHCCFIFQVIVTVLNGVLGILKHEGTRTTFEWISFGFSVFLFVTMHLFFLVKMTVAILKTKRRKEEDRKRYLDLNPGQCSAPGSLPEMEHVKEKGKPIPFNGVSPI